MKTITRWLAPPVFEYDDEKTRQAMLINLIGVMCIAFTLIVMAGVLLGGNTPTSTLIIDLVACVMILQFLRWLRSGKVALAGIGLVTFGLVYLTGVTANIGTIRAPTAAIFVFWVLMTGLLFDLRGILIGTAAASLAVLGLIVAENGGWLRQPTYEVGLTQWVTFTALFGFTSGLTYYIIRGTKIALSLAQKEIEHRNQVEAALKESEQRYRTLVEWTLDPIAVHRDGKTLYVNPAAIKLFGATSASDLVGKSLLERVHPEHRQASSARVKSLVELGLQSPMFEQKLLKLDGTVMDVEVQGMIISYDGRPAVQIAIRDITESKRTEAALRESEQRYRTLVEWTPEPLVVCRGDSILFVNPAAARMFGAESASDLVGGSMLDRIHPDYHQIVASRVRDFADHGLNSPMMVQKLLRLDGNVMDVEVRGSIILYDGEVARQTSMRDITDRKAIEAALDAARLKAEDESHAKSRFLASASHDLRQPAHALGMFVARLVELPLDAQARDLVESIDASVRAMQDMLDGFFDLSRLDSEQTQISRVAFPIERVFGQLRDSFASAAADKGLRLRLRPSKAWVESDPGLIHRILLNLVSNAVRYTQHGGILVACRPIQDGTQLRIEVRDSGVGIAAQHHAEIFQEFFQVENPERDRNKGLGVGLSIVDRACRLLNHHLTMRSALGCGTRFTLTVPLAPAPPDGAYEDATLLTAKVEFDGLRVLLIEDHILGRVGLASLLTSWGCSVTEAEGANAACKLHLGDQTADIIISDFRLGGGINGIEAVDMLSANAGRRIAACLISGDTDANVNQQAQAAGLTLLQKPVRPAKLRSLLRHLIRARAIQ